MPRWPGIKAEARSESPTDIKCLTPEEKVTTAVFPKECLSYQRVAIFGHIKPILVNQCSLADCHRPHAGPQGSRGLRHSHVVFVSHALCLTHRFGMPEDVLGPAPNHFAIAHYPRVSSRSAVVIRRSKSSSIYGRIPPRTCQPAPNHVVNSRITPSPYQNREQIAFLPSSICSPPHRICGVHEWSHVVSLRP